MRPAKLKILYILFALMFVPGCSDDNDEEEVDGFDYYIRFNANGNQKEYKFDMQNSIPDTRLIGIVNGDDSMWGEYSFDQDGYLSFINANAGTNIEDAEFFQFVVLTADVINTNLEYTEDNTLVISGFYNDGANVYAHESLDDSNDLEITWTSITETEARGRFSGTLYDENNLPLEIRDGEFFIFNSAQ